MNDRLRYGRRGGSPGGGVGIPMRRAASSEAPINPIHRRSDIQPAEEADWNSYSASPQTDVHEVIP
ncbi:MAG TPA: hypothetical protein VEX68_28535 [Bryobacteraceae bacterium]|nr:hypothetical protein [Bryobacteraceae bacterium]